MAKVHKEFQNKDVAFLLVYVREPHPGEGVPPHTSYEQKVQHACRLRDEEKISSRILVDTLDGAVHRAYGTLPNACYIVDKRGIIVFKAQWTDAVEVGFALRELLLREERLAQGYDLKEAYIEKMHFPPRDLPERDRVLGRGGAKSVADWEDVHGKIKTF